MLLKEDSSIDYALFHKAPCIGICSTTYGDAVCRGCRRYSFEIIQWNQLSLSEKKLIWLRLENARVKLLRNFFIITDRQSLERGVIEYHISLELGRNPYWVVFELITKLAKRNPDHTLENKSYNSKLSQLGIRQTDQKDINKMWTLRQFYHYLHHNLYTLAVAEYENQYKNILERTKVLNH